MLFSDRKIWIPIASAFVFGMYPAASQLSYKHGANPTFLIIVTTFCRALSLLVFSRIHGYALTQTDRSYRPVLLAALFQAISVFGIISSLSYIPGPVMIVIVFTSTLMLLVLLAIRGEATLDGATVLSTLGAFIGVAFVVDVFQNFEALPWRGILLAFAAAVATTGRVYIFGKEVAVENPAVTGARIFSITFLFTLFLLFFDSIELPDSLTGWLAVALACGSLSLGSFGMFYGISAVGAFEFSLFVKLEPVFTSFFAWLILDQLLKGSQYFGILLVIGSLISYHICKFKVSASISKLAEESADPG